MSNLVIVIGLVGSAASIMSFLLERAGIRGTRIHAAYGLFIALFASILVANASSYSAERAALESRIAELTSVQIQAAALLRNTPKENDGERRGFMFASLAFLESQKLEMADTYDMARQFAVSSGLLENKQADGMERLYQGWALIDG